MKRFPAIVAPRSILLLSASAAVQQAADSCQGVEKVFDGAKAETHVRGRGGQRERTRSLELQREGGRLRVTLDGRQLEADAVEIAPGTYSILLAGRSFEVRVLPAEGGLRVHIGAEEFAARVLDPRAWRGKRGGVLEAEGRQQIIAPMPGKVVRLLVKAGDAVEAGQGLL